MLGEAALYDRFNIQATVSPVSSINNHERDGKMMAVRTAVVHDKTSFATMTVFPHPTKEIADGKYYQFTNVNMGQYKKGCVLKTRKEIINSTYQDLFIHNDISTASCRHCQVLSKCLQIQIFIQILINYT